MQQLQEGQSQQPPEQQEKETKTSKKQSKVLHEQIIHENKWLGLKYTTYSIGDRVVPNYETVYRTTTKNSGRDIDGVEIIPVIKYGEGKCAELVMIANFRPPVNGFVLEFPSGLVESTDYQQDAKREVLEETGYIIKQFLPIPALKMFSDPWKSNQSGLFYLGLIDGTDPNYKKEQQLQDSENIVVHKLPLNSKLIQNVHALVQQNNYLMESKVWSVCVGLAMTHILGAVGVNL